MRGYIPPKDEAEKMLFKRVQDLARRVSARGGMAFTAFLNEREIDLACAALHTVDNSLLTAFYGGQETAERKMLGISDQDSPIETDFPLSAIQISCKGSMALTHRDFLGSLLGLGLDRNTIGDIYVTNGAEAVCYLTSVAAALAEQELTSVGRCSAQVSAVQADSKINCSIEPQKSGVLFVVSPRLDTVLAGVIKNSRSEAQSMLRRSLVQVNHMLITDTSFLIEDGDVLSVRNYGKYKIQCAGTTSKKGRLRMEWTQY